MQIPSNVQNQDTKDAMKETEYMIRHPETEKSYSSFSELIADLDDEETNDSGKLPG